MSLPGSAIFGVSTDKLPSGFQFLVLLQTYIVASDVGSSGPGTFDYTMDLGNTAHISLGVPAGTDLTAAGGLPTFVTPEPATWIFAGLGGLVGIWKRRRAA